MKKNKLLLICGGLLFSTNFFFAFERVSTNELLMSYLENDSDLKKTAISTEKAQLSLDSTLINNGFDIELSTGNITISADSNGTIFSVKPSVQASIPQASNLKISASSTYNYKNASSEIKDTKISTSVDILSNSSLNREISLLKAERSLEEAKRKLKKQAISAEKSFYTELKSLLNSTSSIITAQKNLYTSKIDFEKIKAQGFTSSSSTYRLAQTKVQSEEHEIERSTRLLIHAYVTFYKKCGHDVSFDAKTDFYSLLPDDIPEIEPVDVNSLNPDCYSEIENALWTNKINSMQRNNSKDYSLSANGGFTFNNSATSSNTIDAGLSSIIGGVNLSTGISFPISDSFYPSFSLSASVSPNAFRQNSITKQQNALAEKEEKLAIETARWNYELNKSEWIQSLEDLLWNKKNDEASYNNYVTLEKDMGRYYRQGIISQSEYYSARTNLQSYTVKKIINAIDLIIYNDNILSMFTEENK